MISESRFSPRPNQTTGEIPTSGKCSFIPASPTAGTSVRVANVTLTPWFTHFSSPFLITKPQMRSPNKKVGNFSRFRTATPLQTLEITSLMFDLSIILRFFKVLITNPGTSLPCSSIRKRKTYVFYHVTGSLRR